MCGSHTINLLKVTADVPEGHPSCILGNRVKDGASTVWHTAASARRVGGSGSGGRGVARDRVHTRRI
jgi:hypothetical protein